VGRSKDKKGNTKEGSTTYEVFIPTFESGTHAKGYLVITSRNGVPCRRTNWKRRGRRGRASGKARRRTLRRNSIAGRDRPEVKECCPSVCTTHTKQPFEFNQQGQCGAGIILFSKTCELTLVRRETTWRAGNAESSIYRRAPMRNLATTRIYRANSPVRFGSTPRTASSLAHGWPR